MKIKLLLLATITIGISSCGVNCDDYPVHGRYRGHYEFSNDKGLHYVGLDENFDTIDIVIPEKYYLVVDGEPKCYCNYGDK